MPDQNRGRDARDEARVALGTTGLIAGLFAISSPVQMFLVLSQGDRWTDDPSASILPDILQRFGANLAALTLLLLLLAILRLYDRGRAGRAGVTTVSAFIATLFVVALRAAMGVYPTTDPYRYVMDGLTTFAVLILSILLGLAQADSRRRLRLQERAAGELRLRSVEALDALQSETLRVRREVADGLHGTLQHQLIIVGVWLESLRAKLAPADLPDLDRIVAELSHVRETEVRQLSHTLYPAGLDRGASVAVRGMLRRLPETIATALHVDEDFAILDSRSAGDALPLARRILLVRLVEEALTNALRHGNASEIRVHFGLDDGTVTLVVDDDGSGHSSSGASVVGGLTALGQQAEAIGGSVVLSRSRELGGAQLRARVPLPAVDPVAPPSSGADERALPRLGAHGPVDGRDHGLQ